ncbi:MAG TPA: glycosyltransferase family 4 protein [bacterium]|nr:glycosyltransferase family 4 protein [bacterium]
MMQKTPKVLIFSLTYLPFIGGAEVAVSEITKKIAGIEFDIITCNLDGCQQAVEQKDNIKIYRVGHGKNSKRFFPWLAYKKALELHRLNNYSLIWSIMANRAGLAALFFKRKFSDVKFLLTLQEGDSLFSIWKKTWYFRPIYKKIYTRADHIQAISQWLARRARSYGYKKDISVVPNGVDLDKFKTQNSKLKTKEELSIKPEDKIILTDSRLVVKNGVADLIKSVHILVTHYPLLTPKLVILGSGPLEKQLKQFALRLGVTDKIIFLGRVPHEQIQDYYQIADIFVRPSLTEGFGNVFVQAMAASLPVIATPVGGILDFFKDSETGWFCEVKNPQSIAEKINYILEEKNKDEVERVVANARHMVEEKYDWNLIADKMKNIFDSIMHNS